MQFHVVLTLNHDEAAWLLSMADAASASRNPARRALAKKIRDGVDAAEVEPADEPLLVQAREIGGEAGGA